MFNETETANTTIALWSAFLERALRQQPQWAQVVFLVTLFSIFVTSIVGNLLTCIVIYYDKTMHTATNYYLFNLAASDLIVTFAILLDVQDFMSEAYQFGRITCKVHYFFVVALWNNSILTMTALAIERYIAIWYPLLLKATPVWRRVMKIIILIWVVAILETVPELWTIDLIKTQKSRICFPMPTSLTRVSYGVLALVTFVVPLVIMTFVYAMIAFKVSDAQKKAGRNQIFNHKDNRSKVNKLIIALTLSFLVCWLPFFTVRLLYFAFDVHQLMRLPELWSVTPRLVSLHSWFSSVLNPLLFSLMSTKFRRALKTLWGAKFKRKNQRKNIQTILVIAT